MKIFRKMWSDPPVWAAPMAVYIFIGSILVLAFHLSGGRTRTVIVTNTNDTVVVTNTVTESQVTIRGGQVISGTR